MKKQNLIVVHEFGTLIKKGEKVFLNDKEDEVALSGVTFNNLWDFILENKTSDDIEQVMSVHKKKGRQYIKCSRYVGTIQTKDGCTIEILPKIFGCSSRSKEDIKKSRKVFLNMLKKFRDSESKTFQNVNLSTSENFPILEVYISNYIAETENILRSGLKKNYTKIQEKSKFLKGKLLVSKQIRSSLTDKIHFHVEYAKYLEDIPQNRIIVSTLKKLLQLTHSNENKARIGKMLAIFSEVPESFNINDDLKKSLYKNRLFASYENLMLWSSQFLLNRGFTTFSGNHVNQSLLFSAEKLFESYVAALFKDYARRHGNLNVYSQHRKYYLVDKHNKKGKFQIRPDIFAESADKNNFLAYENIILDTKWKIIDENRPDKNYFMSIADMYQMYAYGQKYALGDGYFYDVNPRLVLIYPATESFTKELPSFFYEEIKKEYGLKLSVCPFNLSKIKNKEIDEQIKTILEIAIKNEHPLDGSTYEKQTGELIERENSTISLDSIKNKNKEQVTSRYMLVGYVKSKEHWEWINANKLYNVRVDGRLGTLNEAEMQIMPSRLFLYDSLGNAWMCSVNQAECFYVNGQEMDTLGYPKTAIDNRFYKLYSIAEIREQEKISIDELKKKYGCKDGAPIFVKF